MSAFNDKHIPLSSVYPCEENRDMIRQVPLLSYEQTLPIFEPPIVTITWFEGNFQAAANFFQQRILQMHMINPWVGGSFQSSEQNADIQDRDITLVYFEGAPVSDREIKRIFQVVPVTKSGANESSTICEGMCLDDIVDEAYSKSWMVSLARNLVGTGKPIFQATLIADSQYPDEKFALIVSLSHRAGDGSTYYELYNMLMASSSITQLNPNRKPKVLELIAKEVGVNQESVVLTARQTVKYRAAQAFMKVRGVCPDSKIFIVDQAFVREAKDAAAKQGVVPFVSSNDIIMSHFCQAIKADWGKMALNFRGRIKGCNWSDAGNYVGHFMYLPSEYATPSLIRKSIVSGHKFEQSSEVMKSNMRSTFSSLVCGHIFSTAWCANWASIKADSDFVMEANEPAFRLRLHMPLPVRTRLLPPICASPSLTTTCLIFYARPGQLAILINGYPEIVATVARSKLVNREAVEAYGASLSSYFG